MMQWTDFGQGPVHSTGRTLDVALNGSGFLVVDTPNGPRYSRAGALTITRDGTLATADGYPVLGDRGPLVVGTGRIGDRGVAGGGEITRVDAHRSVSGVTGGRRRAGSGRRRARCRRA